METPFISYEKHPGFVGLITLDRRDKLNALNEKMWEERFSAIHEAEGDDQVRALMLAGSERAFSAGADLAQEGGGRPSRP